VRHLFSYLVFVGIPFAGLLLVLRLGQGVDAPIAVHGAYAVQPMAAAGMVCHQYLLTGADSTFRLMQSGRELSGTLGPLANVSVRGSLNGTDLTLEGEILPGTTPRHLACPVGDTLRVTAEVQRRGPVKRLEGRLWTSGCAECGAVGFTAARPRAYAGRRRA
jgi:hypothetical protein